MVASKTNRTKKTEQAMIVIPKINRKVMEVEIEGYPGYKHHPGPSLIMNHVSEKVRNTIREKQGEGGKATKPKVRKARDPQKEYEDSKYVDSDGDLALPCVWFKSAVLDAAAAHDGVTKRSISRAVFFLGEFVKVKGKPTFREDYVRLANGSFDLRYRAEFKKWSVTLLIEYNADMITLEQLVNLLNFGGYACGVGDWRPGSKTNLSGEHGRYQVKV